MRENIAGWGIVPGFSVFFSAVNEVFMPRHSDPLLISPQSWNKSGFWWGICLKTLAVLVNADCNCSREQRSRLFTGALGQAETIDHPLGSGPVQLFCKCIPPGRLRYARRFLRNACPGDMREYLWVAQRSKVKVCWKGHRNTWVCEETNTTDSISPISQSSHKTF